MAPEQLLAKKIDGRTDQFSLAVMADRRAEIGLPIRPNGIAAGGLLSTTNLSRGRCAD
jgi:hypothetical protein